MWIAALAVACVLITWSTVKIIAANPRTPLPMGIGRPEHEPGSALVMRLVGVAIALIAGVLMRPDDMMVQFLIGVVLIFVPTFALIARHNAVVRSR